MEKKFDFYNSISITPTGPEYRLIAYVDQINKNSFRGNLLFNIEFKG
jgi:hypothetical protein